MTRRSYTGPHGERERAIMERVRRPMVRWVRMPDDMLERRTIDRLVDKGLLIVEGEKYRAAPRRPYAKLHCQK